MGVNIMFYKFKIIFLILTFSVIGSSGFAANIYVDQTLNQNITDGKYSIENRNNSGSDGNAYTTIQAAVNAMNGGDDIYLRGGTYTFNNNSVLWPAGTDGTNDNWSSIQSLPGEWAILDGENNLSNRSLLGYPGSGGAGPIRYWKFERLEIKNAGNDEAYAAIFVNYGPIIVRYCYLHDNTCPRAGLNNAGAIKGSQLRDSIIEYNYFYNNGGINDNYGADIMIFSDYKNPEDVDINNATRNNTIRYNYFVNSQQAIKYKSMQYLSLDHSGNHTAYKDYGDNIHHNIIVNAANEHVFNQDFIQVHHNIFDSCFDIRTVQGSSGVGAYRVFYQVYYNNSFLNTRFRVARNYKGGEYATDVRNYNVPNEYDNYHPHTYVYNNIIENVEGFSSDGAAELTIFHSWSDHNYINYLDWNTMDVNYNLFYPDSQTDEVFRVGYGHEFSVNSLESAGYATINYATMNSGLHPTGNYKVNSLFGLGRNEATVNSGGKGGDHPYLADIKIPSYLGVHDPQKDSAANWNPTNPDPDDAGWIDYVLSLQRITSFQINNGGSLPLPPPTWPSEPFTLNN